MIDRMLVPLDGSGLSARILGTVRSILSRRPEAEVMLLGVVAPASPERNGDSVQATCEYLERERHSLANACGARARFDLATGDPVESILTFARSYGPSLIAMTTRGRAGLSRWREGSVTEEVVRRSPHLVLACNPLAAAAAEHGDERGFRKILVALDGSAVSGTIVPFVGELARLCRSSVTIVHVVHPATFELEYGIDLPIPRDAAAELVEPELKVLRMAGVPVRVVTVIGTPARSILDVAAAEKYDLVAMTTHGRSGLSRLVFGSVTEEVLRSCRSALLVQSAAGRPLATAEASHRRGLPLLSPREL